MNKQAKLAMNLNVLKRHDPHIVSILDSTPYAVLYEFDGAAWSKKNIEGTLFLYARSISPYYGLFIINRLSTSNYLMSLTDQIDIQLNAEYIMYKQKSDDGIYGVWIFEEGDRLRIHKRAVELCKNPKPSPDLISSTTTLEKTTPKSQSLDAKAATQDLMAFLKKAGGGLPVTTPELPQDPAIASVGQSIPPKPSSSESKSSLAPSPELNNNLFELLKKAKITTDSTIPNAAPAQAADQSVLSQSPPIPPPNSTMLPTPSFPSAMHPFPFHSFPPPPAANGGPIPHPLHMPFPHSLPPHPHPHQFAPPPQPLFLPHAPNGLIHKVAKLHNNGKMLEKSEFQTAMIDLLKDDTHFLDLLYDSYARNYSLP
ncbi:hypothetical protein BKA69DRAFT_456419 [Paraphysoderma sedebokerense]|nr:hypothetical protein BKA69DRAFT_456419 [Paraphysoderma sedebokerense]